MKPDADRARLPERLEAGGAIALFVFLFFLHWYGGSISGLFPGSHISGGTVEATGWEAFTSSRWIWLGTIVFALCGALAGVVAYRFEGRVQIGAVVLGLGALSSVLIVYRILFTRGPTRAGTEYTSPTASSSASGSACSRRSRSRSAVTCSCGPKTGRPCFLCPSANRGRRQRPSRRAISRSRRSGG